MTVPSWLVKDRDLSSPPSTPTIGDRYIVGTSPSGAWAGHANDIAVWKGTAWTFIAAQPGLSEWIADERAHNVYFDGVDWISPSDQGSIDAKTDFHAKGNWNGTTGTDDTAALNAFFAYIRSLRDTTTTSPEGTAPIMARLPPGRYLCNGSVNATNIKIQNLVIDCAGAELVGRCTGKPVLDMLGTRWSIFENPPSIWGDATNKPSYGIQMGMVTAVGAHTGEMSIDDLRIDGYFSIACIYNFSAETIKWGHPQLFNRASDAGSYCLILDGANWQNITSEFVTQTITQGTQQSNIHHVFDVADIRKLTSGSPILIMGNVSQLAFRNSYCVSLDDYIIKTFKSQTMRNLRFDLHAEAVGALGLLLVDTVNPASAVVIYGLMIADHTAHYSSSIINTTGSTRQLIIEALDLYIGSADSAIPIFGTGSGGIITNILASGVVNWFAATLSLANCCFTGRIVTSDASTTTIIHTSGSYSIAKRGASTTDRTMQHKGNHRIIGRVDNADVTNFVELQGNTTGGRPAILTDGDPNVGLDVKTKGTGWVHIQAATPGSTNGSLAFHKSKTALSNDGNNTLTAAQFRGGIIEHSGMTANRTDTTPTAAQLVADIPGAVVGTTYMVIFANTDDTHSMIIGAGSGVTLVGNATIPFGATVRAVVHFINVTGGAEAVSIYL